MAKVLKEKCISVEVLSLVGSLDSLQKRSEMMTFATRHWRSTWWNRSPLQTASPGFRAYDNVTISLIFPAEVNLVAKLVGLFKKLINDQMFLNIMPRMPPVDWKQWAIDRLVWIHGEVELVSETSWSRNGEIC
jgi:hypothetical protein